MTERAVWLRMWASGCSGRWRPIPPPHRRLAGRHTAQRAGGPQGGDNDLIYAGAGHEVQSVMVAGRFLMRDRQILVAGEEAVRLEAQRQGEEVSRRVAADPVHRGMALLEPMQRGQL